MGRITIIESYALVADMEDEMLKRVNEDIKIELKMDVDQLEFLIQKIARETVREAISEFMKAEIGNNPNIYNDYKFPEAKFFNPACST